MATTSSRTVALAVAVVMAAAATLLAAGCDGDGGNGNGDGDGVSGETTDGATGNAGVPGVPGVETTGLSSVIDHPYVAFGSVTRAVYEGTEVDENTGEEVAIGVESVPTGKTATVAGVEVAVVEVVDSEDGEVIERTEDYYAQGPDGTVYYLGERVDDIEDGEVVGHHGQWLAGEGDAVAGIFMPPEPQVGEQFEQERAPGVAEDESQVVEVDLTITVPAGTFTDCIKTEDLDPIDDVTESKYYCRGVGLVREEFPAGGTLDLVEIE